jgi:hypothetical protein
MSAPSSQRSIFRGIRVAGTPTISAHRASNAIGFFRAFEKRRASGACGVRPRIDRSEPKGASSRDKETEGIWNTTRPQKRGRSKHGALVIRPVPLQQSSPPTVQFALECSGQ